MDPTLSSELYLQPSKYTGNASELRAESCSSSSTLLSSIKPALAIPALPRRPFATAQVNMSNAIPRTSRLKRLSLLSRTIEPTIDRPIDGDGPGSAASTSSVPGTPHRGKTGLRTSIPYSPATAETAISPRSTTRHGRRSLPRDDAKQDEMPGESGAGSSEQRRTGRNTDTLVER